MFELGTEEYLRHGIKMTPKQKDPRKLSKKMHKKKADGKPDKQGMYEQDESVDVYKSQTPEQNKKVDYNSFKKIYKASKKNSVPKKTSVKKEGMSYSDYKVISESATRELLDVAGAVGKLAFGGLLGAGLLGGLGFLAGRALFKKTKGAYKSIVSSLRSDSQNKAASIQETIKKFNPSEKGQIAKTARKNASNKANEYYTKYYGVKRVQAISNNMDAIISEGVDNYIGKQVQQKTQLGKQLSQQAAGNPKQQTAAESISYDGTLLLEKKKLSKEQEAQLKAESAKIDLNPKEALIFFQKEYPKTKEFKAALNKAAKEFPLSDFKSLIDSSESQIQEETLASENEEVEFIFDYVSMLIDDKAFETEMLLSEKLTTEAPGGFDDIFERTKDGKVKVKGLKRMKKFLKSYGLDQVNPQKHPKLAAEIASAILKNKPKSKKQFAAYRDELENFFYNRKLTGETGDKLKTHLEQNKKYKEQEAKGKEKPGEKNGKFDAEQQFKDLDDLPPVDAKGFDAKKAWKEATKGKIKPSKGFDPKKAWKEATEGKKGKDKPGEKNGKFDAEQQFKDLDDLPPVDAKGFDAEQQFKDLDDLPPVDAKGFDAEQEFKDLDKKKNKKGEKEVKEIPADTQSLSQVLKTEGDYYTNMYQARVISVLQGFPTMKLNKVGEALTQKMEESQRNFILEEAGKLKTGYDSETLAKILNTNVFLLTDEQIGEIFAALYGSIDNAKEKYKEDFARFSQCMQGGTCSFDPGDAKEEGKAKSKEDQEKRAKKILGEMREVQKKVQEVIDDENLPEDEKRKKINELLKEQNDLKKLLELSRQMQALEKEEDKESWLKNLVGDDTFSHLRGTAVENAVRKLVGAIPYVGGPMAELLVPIFSQQNMK